LADFTATNAASAVAAAAAESSETALPPMSRRALPAALTRMMAALVAVLSVGVAPSAAVRSAGAEAAGASAAGVVGGGGRGRMFATGELRLLLLSLVAEQDRHGYELIKAVEDLTGGQYAPSPGVVYPTLALLVDEGLIAEAAGEGTRKAFAVTEAGRTELAGKTDELKVIVARLTSLAQAGEREASPPVRRAFANLALALRQRVALANSTTQRRWPWPISSTRRRGRSSGFDGAALAGGLVSRPATAQRERPSTSSGRTAVG
jgi:DNA-binding PadR family transcriptional regulator